VEELDEEARAVRSDGLGDAGELRDDLLRVAGEGVRREQSRRVDGGRLEDDQPGSAAGARLVVGDEVVGGEMIVDERRLVRGRDDAVGELDRPDAERAEEAAKNSVQDGPRRRGVLGACEARTQGALVFENTGATEDDASRRPGGPAAQASF
jgi:hypothetical protein